MSGCKGIHIFRKAFDDARCITGVYGIKNASSGYIYVGATIVGMGVNRWPDHLLELRKGTHHCSHLQRAWTKQGAESFEFVVLRDLSSLKDSLSRKDFQQEVYQHEAEEASQHPRLYNSFLPDAIKRMTFETGKLGGAALKKRFEEDPEAKQAWIARLVITSTESWEDLVVRDKRLAGMKRANTPDVQKRRQYSLNSPEVKEKRALNELNPVRIEVRKEAGFKSWDKRRSNAAEDPARAEEYDRKWRASLKVSANKPEVRKANSQRAANQCARQREAEALDPALRAQNFAKRSAAISAGRKRGKLRRLATIFES